MSKYKLLIKIIWQFFGKKTNMKTKFTSFYLIIDLLLIAAITIYISFAAGLWNGYPIGTDAYAHLSKLQFMFDAWPHFEWNSLWANGMPMFLWYSIVPYLIMLVGKFVFGSLELSMQICAVAAILLMAVSIFLIVHHASRSRLASWLSALILLSMPALWGRIAMGEIPRLLATAFLPLAWYMVIRYLSSKKPSYILHFCTIIVVALSLSGHYIMTGLTVVSLLLIILIYVDYRQIWSYLVKLILPALLLAAFTLLPFLTTSGLKQVYGTGLFGGDTIQPFTNFSKLLFSSFPLNSRLDWINADYGNSLHWLVLPLFILFIFLSLHRRDKYDKDHHEYAEWRVIKSFLYLSGLFVAYGFAMYVGYPRNWYNAALPPADAFYFLSLSLPIVIGLGFHFGIKKNIARIFVFLISIGLIAMVINHLYPWPNFLIKQNDSYRYFNQEHTVNNEFNDTLSASDHNSDYRWAHNNSNIAIWFNYDYQMPQTRDYFSQALLNQDDKFWFENSVFALSDNYTETKYLLDWFAVKYLSVSYPNFNFAKFDQNDDLFKPIASNQNNDPNNKISTYEYLNPSPILSATNAKSILIIGDSSSYHNFMLSLSGTDYDSSYIIPVQGEQTLDLYSLDELQKI